MLRNRVACALVACLLALACEGSPAAPQADAPAAHSLASVEPAKPTGLSATPGLTTVDLAWANSSNETYYELGRALAPGTTVPTAGSYVLVTSPAADQTAYQDTGVSPTTRYRYRLRACSADGCSGYAYVYVTTLTPPKPPTPTNLAAVWSGGDVDLTWNDGAHETAYRIDRALAPLGGTISGLVVLSEQPANTTAYGDATAEQGMRYRYRIRACNLTVCSSYATVYIAVPPPPPPGVPTDFAAEVDEDGDVDLVWTAPGNQTSFKLQRAVAPERGAVGTNVNLPTQTGGATSFTDGAAQYSTRYRYRIQACNNGGCSDYVELFLSMPAPPPPATTPSGFAAEGNDVQDVVLEWVDSSNETRYEIERALAPSGTTISGNTKIATPEADATTYIDETAAPGKRYRFRIRACNGAGCSGYATIYFTVPLPPPPPAPESFSASPDDTGDVHLEWTDVTGETLFKVRRTVAPLGGALGTTVTFPNVAANTTAYTDAAAATGTRYRYRVQACNQGGCSAHLEQFVTTPVPAGAPPGFSGIPDEDGDVVLTWVDSPNETSYQIDRALAPSGTTIQGGVTVIATPGTDVLTYTDEAAVVGKRYRYRIRACNAVGCSRYVTTYVLVTGPTAPAIPTDFDADVGPGLVVLTWTDLPDEDSYEIERALAPEVGAISGITVIATLAANETSFNDETVAPDSRYRYRIRACNEIGCSGYRTVYQSTLPVSPPFAPSFFEVTLVTQEEVALTWSDVEGELEYRIERRPSGGVNRVIALVDANTTAFTDYAATSGTHYRYIVRACNAGGCSGANIELVDVPADPSPFDVQLVFEDYPTESERDAFRAAEERWESVITGELTDIALNEPADAFLCFPAINETIDDLKIYVYFANLPTNVLGSAGPCLIRGSLTALVGFMEFDREELENLPGGLEGVILHEMGHVLGIGTLWNIDPGVFGGRDLLNLDSTSDPYFTGEQANVGFDNVGGGAYVGNTVPVEGLAAGAGTAFAHWRESIFDNELMTGFAEVGAMPMSEITIRSLTDIGYTVDPGQADAYSWPVTALRRGPVVKIELKDDIRRGPIRIVP